MTLNRVVKLTNFRVARLRGDLTKLMFRTESAEYPELTKSRQSVYSADSVCR